MIVRNFLKHMIVCVTICIVFTIATILNCNIDNRFPSEANTRLAVNESLHNAAPVNFKLSDTVVGREGINDSLFSDCYYALFIDETDNVVYAAKNAHTRMYPASMTKLMTAIIVAEKIESGQISENDIVTVSHHYDLTYEGVGPCELQTGSQISVKDLLYGLLIQSNNYYGLILAEYISSDVSSFCTLMNEKALEIGATNTHYVNPHGLDNSDHYSTAYDTYLVIKEAYTHEIIKQIDTCHEYSYTYYNSAGVPIETDISATNLFYRGNVTLPSNYEIAVWKTGTTDGAGNCLVLLLTKDGHEYVAVASNGESKKALYDAIIKLLCLVS